MSKSLDRRPRRFIDPSARLFALPAPFMLFILWARPIAAASTAGAPASSGTASATPSCTLRARRASLGGLAVFFSLLLRRSGGLAPAGAPSFVAAEPATKPLSCELERDSREGAAKPATTP